MMWHVEMFVEAIKYSLVRPRPEMFFIINKKCCGERKDTKEGVKDTKNIN